MRVRQLQRLVFGGIIAAAGLVTPVSGQRPQLGVLDELQSGRWELRLRGNSATAESMCLQSGRSLIQIRHQHTNCDRYIVNDGLNDVTVQYTCHGQGYGLTHIRRESARLVQIESQGIARGLPFDLVAEARRVGDCTA